MISRVLKKTKKQTYLKCHGRQLVMVVAMMVVVVGRQLVVIGRCRDGGGG